jgi:PAS domain S-box-containing protein
MPSPSAANSPLDLDALLDLASDAIFARDLDEDTIRYWNLSAERLYGWRSDEAIGRRPHELLNTEFPEPLDAIQAQLFAVGRWSGELIHTARDGARRHVVSRWSLQRDAEGRPQAILELNTDVTERRAAEQALRAREAMLGALLRNLPDHVFIKDREGRFLVANEAIAAHLDRPVADIVGRHTEAVFPPEVAAQIRAGELKVMAERRAVVEPLQMESAAYLVTAAPYESADGEVLGVVGISRDVTESVRQEAALREANEALRAMNEEVQAQSEELTQQNEELIHMTDELAAQTARLLAQQVLTERIIQNMPSSIAYLDQDLVYRWHNPAHARTIGKASADVLGRTPADVQPVAAQTVVPLMHRVLETGETHLATAVPITITRDGRSLLTHWDLAYVAVPDEAGKTVGVLSLAQEVTERKAVDVAQRERIAALEEADRVKDEFLSMLSHDLRTPLNAVLGYAGMIEDATEGTLQTYAERITKAGNTLLTLIEDLLTLSRVQAGKLVLDERPTDIAAEARDLMAVLTTLADKKQLRLEVDVPDDLPILEVDSPRVAQVLTNLLGNAFKFTPEGGRVTLRLRHTGDVVRAEVSDTGPGIPPAEQPKLFARFSQLSKSSRLGGAGLGLSIAKALVEAHGGQIGVESHDGAGTTFWFTLPVPAGPLQL